MDPLLQRMEAMLKHLKRTPPGPILAAEIAHTLERWRKMLEASAEGEGEMPLFQNAAASGAGDEYQVWCDGSCAPNPGPGGWGAIIENQGQRQELSGSAPQSTNNIMELTAALEALKRIPAGARITVTTDSRYLKDGITTWLANWKRRGWRKSDGEAVLNQPLWQALDAVIAERRVKFAWVRGHSGHAENERCDVLANEARLAQS